MSAHGCITIQIDGQALQVEPGLTILQAARQHNIDIPTLCDFPGLPAHGSCRMCVVEIAGRANTPTACTTPVEEGMVVSTHSPAVVALRKELLQMLLAEHPSGCLFCPERDHCDECMVTLRKAGVTTGCGSCPKDSQCELQALAEKYEVHQPGYPVRYRMLPVETYDPFFDRDPNLCILCGRCVRVCQDLHFANTLTYKGRGPQALVSTAFQRSHLESNCTFCGSCVEVCPTGAISEKTRKWDGKPERVTASTCPFCSIGCQISLLSKKERVIGSLPDQAAGTELLCVNGRFGVTELVNPTTRLRQAQQGTGETAQPVGWEEAIQTAAEKLAACPPERFQMRIAADCTNEDLFVARQFARQAMKSSLVLDAVQQRYSSALDSLMRLMSKPATLKTAAEADVILCIGMDDRYAQSVVAAYLKRAKSRGAKLIHVSTRRVGYPELSWSDVRIAPAEGGGLQDSLQALAACVEAGCPAQAGTAVEEARRLLEQSTQTVIVVGATALADPQNAAILQQVEALAQRLEAQVSLLPEESNLTGALRTLSIGQVSAYKVTPESELDVLYLIGEARPAGHSGAFIISHELALPDDEPFNGLLFPAAAFSEVDGTMIDYAGRRQTFRPAVAPPGEAQPAWKILAQIAQALGAPGFDYQSVEDVWQAMQDFDAWTDTCEAAEPAGTFLAPGGGWREPVYMGQPLAQRVAGLRYLYPESSTVRAHEPNS